METPNINDTLDILVAYYMKECSRIFNKKTSMREEKDWMLKLSRCLIEISKEFSRQKTGDEVSNLSDEDLDKLLRESRRR